MTTTASRRLRPLSRSRTITTLVVVLVLAIVVGVWWWREHRTGVEFTARFTEAVGVYPGSDVRVLGVRVGEIDSVAAHGGQVRVAMHLDPGVSAAAQTGAVIISPNLVSDRYIQLTKPYTGGAKLANGTAIPLSRTRTPVELDDLYRSLLSVTNALGPKGANANGALSRLLDTGAANLGGTGKTFNRTIAGLSQASDTLSGSKDNIFATLSNLASFTNNLAQNNSGLVKVNQELASVTTTLSDDRQSFAEALQKLSYALRLVQSFVHDNRSALSSNVAQLSKVAQTLAAQRTSVEKALSAAPLLVDNFINAYDPQHNLLRGRVNLNEIGVWNRQVNQAGSATAAVPLTGPNAPPSLLPSSNVTSGGGR